MKKQIKIPIEIMQQLAKNTRLTFDGGADDNRLFEETMFTNSKDMTIKEYTAMEKDLANYNYIGNGFEVYAWNDCSGYEYWTLKQEEDNYIQVTIAITSSKAKAEEIKKAATKAHNHFYKYSRY